MNATKVLSAAIISAAILIGAPFGHAAQVGAGRTELQRHGLSTPGHEAVQVRVDLAPGDPAVRHFHPGEEVIYVLQGSIEYTLDGASKTLSAGDVFFIPAGAIHSARNVGTGPASELATYIVEKDKPLITVVP